MASFIDLNQPSTQTTDIEDYIDPADYIFKHSEYHDCQLTLDSENYLKVVIGVVSSHLAAHSSVFRKLFMWKRLNNSNEVAIKDVSPPVFKLLLIHMYGGELPNMTRFTAAEVALAANLYNIRPLVSKVSKLLVPNTVAEVFPALICVAHMSVPELESSVTKIVQQETDALVASKDFLKLDSKCLEFIARQERLSVTELELLKALVRWAEYKAADNPEKTLRQHLQTTMQYVRLTTLSQDDIIKEVMPKEILSPEEAMELLSSVAHNRPWEFPGLCSVRSVRKLSEAVEKSNEDKNSFEPFTIKNYYDFEELPEYATISNLTINVSEDSRIDAFYLQSKSISKLGNRPVYKLNCAVTVSKIEDGFCKETHVVEIGGSVIGSEEILFPLKLRNGKPLRLAAGSSYNFALEFTSPHPVYKPPIYYDAPAEVKFNTPAHVKKIVISKLF